MIRVLKSLRPEEQIVGIVYNPKKLPKPKSWLDLFEEPYVSRLGLTGFQTTFGTVSLIEMAKQFGGSDTNIEPVFAALGLPEGIRYALNHEWTVPGVPLRDGDEVALVLPVSGG